MKAKLFMWTGQTIKAICFSHSMSPVADAITFGQFDLPENYAGKFIHVKAYTKWMLNFDSSFLYNKDIRILSKNAKVTSLKHVAIPELNFFPEGGDAVSGVVNKIAFKANDQWGRPIKIKGVIQNNKNEFIDSIRVIHDGMGFFFIKPKPDETFTAKWKDEKGTEHLSPLPAIKSTRSRFAGSNKRRKTKFFNTGTINRILRVKISSLF